jgi:hypothetical protein
MNQPVHALQRNVAIKCRAFRDPAAVLLFGYFDGAYDDDNCFDRPFP